MWSRCFPVSRLRVTPKFNRASARCFFGTDWYWHRVQGRVQGRRKFGGTYKVKPTPILLQPTKTETDTKTETIQAPTTQNVVAHDMGLQKYLKRVLGFSSMGIAGGLMTAQLLATPLGGVYPIPCLLGGFGLSMASIFGMGYAPYKQTEPKPGEYATENSTARLLSFTGLSAGMGITMAPIFNSVDPTIFPAATVLSLATMGGCMWYAMRQPDASLLKYRGPLFGALTGFIGLGLISIGSMAILGPNVFSNIWMNINTWGGLVLFCGMTGYDVHHAIDRYKHKNADHLGHAANFYLDFCNFFIRFLHILLKAREKSD
jgi:FtsH-binding integral membrane protein